MDTPRDDAPRPDIADNFVPQAPPGPAPSWVPVHAGAATAREVPAPRRHSRWRTAGAATLAGALLATGLGVGAVIGSAHAGSLASATAPTTGGSAITAQQLPQGRGGPSDGQGGPSGGVPGGQGGSTQVMPGQDLQDGNASGSSQPTETDATEAQSQGLVLIDTVLPGGGAAGTGMILDADGTVLTNYHVVEGSTSITVTDAVTGTTYDATVVGHDASADVALLKLDGASDLTPITVDDDADPAVSDEVTAVGNAEGQGYLSASSGTVQALGQSITTSATTSTLGESLKDLIETDAYVVGGYSGGALLDDEGEVVGITTAASSSTQVAQSYAVPIEDAFGVVSQIESGTESQDVVIGASAYLGVQIDDQLLLAAVEDGSPAADAGLAAGDTITALDGTTLATRTDLTDVLAAHEPGDSVTVQWTDSTGATHRGTLVLGSSPVN